MVLTRSFRSPIHAGADGTPLASFEVRSDVAAVGRSVGVVAAFGELDLSTVGEFSQALRHCAAAHCAVIVDLTGITFMDCSALRALVLLRRELEARGGRVCLVATRPSVLRLFELAGSNFSLVPNCEQALDMLGRQAPA